MGQLLSLDAVLMHYRGEKLSASAYRFGDQYPNGRPKTGDAANFGLFKNNCKRRSRLLEIPADFSSKGAPSAGIVPSSRVKARTSGGTVQPSSMPLYFPSIIQSTYFPTFLDLPDMESLGLVLRSS